MKKNGFVFIETIVVTGFLITSLMILYTLFVATNNRETRKLRYDDPPKIYETYYLYRYLESFKLSDLVDNLKECLPKKGLKITFPILLFLLYLVTLLCGIYYPKELVLYKILPILLGIFELVTLILLFIYSKKKN